ncbi:glycosyl hydrolase family 28-related protein [Paenibacillus alginolyticus]|uniref:Right-handed parallel beta-helix repeat-containing protein n=1 Tax=Paenibacillus alginolyticus TaxID=59839 RepID=A0ABT4GAC1_9BACL|nr:right-handed parallel beta-helix repeat-containing protein [Paenibacillus alginolyticus]MCY9693134.1 right-handed parallel beta-helix repeat-containing protein [Paenibacillus alginolyticus]MEC0147221.1 glycosyl hydrolase family 28-related protein [Paenibacillus alginolyticus]
MDENRHTQRETNSSTLANDLPSSPASSLSRRKLLSTLGAAGIALAAGDLFLPSSKTHAAATSTLFYNVKDFGARGNRRYDEDDSPYIQSAIDTAAQSGGIVYIPPGMYFLKIPLRVSANITLMGAGSSSILRSSTHKFGLLNLSAVQHVHIQGLSFQGIGSFGNASVPRIECGIALDQAADITITDCTFSMIDNGIKSVDSNRVVVENCSFDNIIGTLDYDTQGYGIWCSNGKNHHLVQNQFNMLFQPCITLTNGSSHSVIARNRMQKCYQSGIDLISGLKEEPCQLNTLSDNIIENFINSSGNKGYTYGIRLKGHCISNMITANTLNDIEDIGIQLEGQADTQQKRPHHNIIANNQLQAIGNNGIVLINAYDNQIRQSSLLMAKTAVRTRIAIS